MYLFHLRVETYDDYSESGRSRSVYGGPVGD